MIHTSKHGIEFHQMNQNVSYSILSKIIRNISINKCIEKNRLKRRAYIVELSSEMEQCIPAVNDVESYVDGVEIGRVIQYISSQTA